MSAEGVVVGRTVGEGVVSSGSLSGDPSRFAPFAKGRSSGGGRRDDGACAWSAGHAAVSGSGKLAIDEGVVS